MFSLKFTGPRNDADRIIIVPKGTREKAFTTDHYYHTRQAPLDMRAPLTAGQYEIRYVTGESRTTLARAPLVVTPAKSEPGLLRVTRRSAARARGGVEVLLDTAGSMLQRLGGQRRMEIAKRTLTELSTRTIPAGTPFALRVFGRGQDSCGTELDIPLAPLDPAAASARIAALQARDGAKTPIGAALESVRADLASLQGEALVILVTDGEETCGGDPTRAIESLRRSGIDVRVNIVGFAVDSDNVAETFRFWASAANGRYFDARDAAALSRALSLALAPEFEVIDAQGAIIASGVVGADPVSVLPGEHTVRLKGQKETRTASVQSRKTTDVSF
jgi:hypothetical protein